MKSGSGSSFIRLAKFLVDKARQGKLLESAARWLRAQGYFFPMSWEAYRFDEYLRARWQKLGIKSLQGVNAGGKPGLVSVILPAYNGEEFIREAIDSILVQTYPSWELIAVDDGSTDRTGEILDEYALRDGRIRVLHQENRKLPGALNRGFETALGEYYTWTSCDNRLHPDFLEKMVNCLKNHPAWDMVYSNIDIIGLDGEPLRESSEYVTYQYPYGSEHIRLPVHGAELNITPNNFVGSAFLYRRRAACLVGQYTPFLFTIEDYDYWMRVNGLLQLHHASFPDPIYDYRFHRDSLTGHKSELKMHDLQDRLLVWDDFRRDFYLSPSLWHIRTSQHPRVLQISEKLRKLLYDGEDFILSDENLIEKLPHYGLSFIHASIIAVGEPLPASFPADRLALSALIVVGKPNSLPQLPVGWDIGICLSKSSKLDFIQPPENWLVVPDTYNLRAVLDIRARMHILKVLEEKFCEPEIPAVKITVVVCSHRRATMLRDCLQSISAQEFPKKDFELVVVNNAQPGSQAFTQLREVIEEAEQSFFRDYPLKFRWFHCPVPGLSVSRNVALAEARGEVLCFLDDDAIADKNWLNMLWEAFSENPQVGVVGGKILLVDPLPSPPWYRPAWRRFWSHFNPEYESFTRVDTWEHFPWGANWAARRQALRQIGGFLTRYGRHSTRLSGGEEIIATRLIQRLGYTVGVEPGAVVHHQVEAGRFSLSYVWQSIRASRRTWYQLQKEGYVPWELGIRHSLRRIWRAIRYMHKDSIVKPFFTVSAELSAWVWLIVDFFKRMRKPLAGRS